MGASLTRKFLLRGRRERKQEGGMKISKGEKKRYKKKEKQCPLGESRS